MIKKLEFKNNDFKQRMRVADGEPFYTEGYVFRLAVKINEIIDHINQETNTQYQGDNTQKEEE